jgi:hypothetical protein
MTDPYDKIKPSKHYDERLADVEKPGHKLPLEGAESIINTATPLTQSNGRESYIANYLGKSYRVIVSAAVSAGNNIGRIVTAHRNK